MRSILFLLLSISLRICTSKKNFYLIETETNHTNDDTNNDYSLPPGKPGIPCKFERGVNYHQFDIHPELPPKKLPDEQACINLCGETVNCFFYSYEPSENNCYMKYSDQGRRYQSNFNSGNKGCAGEFAITCAIEYGYDYQGHELRIEDNPRKVKDAIGCIFECKKISNCLFWTYSEIAKDCYLKSSSEGRERQDRFTSGNRVCADLPDGTGNRCIIEVGRDYTGHDIDTNDDGISDGPIKVANEVECIMACGENSKCFFWSYQLSSKNCYLKTFLHGLVGDVITDDDFHTGSKDCAEGLSAVDPPEVQIKKCDDSGGSIDLDGSRYGPKYCDEFGYNFHRERGDPRFGKRNRTQREILIPGLDWN